MHRVSRSIGPIRSPLRTECRETPGSAGGQVHQSYSYLKSLIANKNPHVVGPIPTNLFLYFRSV